MRKCKNLWKVKTDCLGYCYCEKRGAAEEKSEREALRNEYRRSVIANLTGQLETTTIIERTAQRIKVSVMKRSGEDKIKSDRSFQTETEKLLTIEKLFETKTDEKHTITGNRLIEILGDYGIKAERKTIYDDIKTLCDSGMDIEITKDGHSNAYYLAQRLFQDEELYVLADAVASAVSYRKEIEGAVKRRYNHIHLNTRQRICMNGLCQTGQRPSMSRYTIL